MQAHEFGGCTIVTAYETEFHVYTRRIDNSPQGC